MSGESLPRSDADVREVNEAFRVIVAENFGQPHDSAGIDAEFNGIIEANYGPYVAQPLVLENVGVFFPYDWEPEELARYQELFGDFTPAPFMGYPTFEEFFTAIRPELNGDIGAFNFLSALAAGKDTIMELALEQKLAYQRAKLLAPDLGLDIDTLRNKLRNYSGNVAGIPEDLLREAYELLNLAGTLVDYKDPNLFEHLDITSEGDTYGIDKQYLLH